MSPVTVLLGDMIQFPCSSWDSPDDQVDDAKVEDLFVGVVVGDLLLLFLNLSHQLFSLLDKDDVRRRQRRERTDSD